MCMPLNDKCTSDSNVPLRPLPETFEFLKSHWDGLLLGVGDGVQEVFPFEMAHIG